MNAAAELKNAPAGASDMAHIVLTFDNNKFASAVYGQFDQNLAIIEQKLGVDLRSKGNQLTVRGPAAAAEQARRACSAAFAGPRTDSWLPFERKSTPSFCSMMARFWSNCP